MAGMKPWERDIIEYRPRIGLQTEIYSLVDPDAAASESTYKPSRYMIRASEQLGVDILEDLIATLSLASSLLKKLEDALANDATFIAYKKAMDDGDGITARSIYINHLSDIKGNPDFDVYPILSDMSDEMEVFLDYLNTELFNGEANYEDLTMAREDEMGLISGWIRLESEDMKLYTSDSLTQGQRDAIAQIIKSEENTYQTEQDYIDDLNDAVLAAGSPRINYEEVGDRIQFLAAANAKSNMFKDSVEIIDAYAFKTLEVQVNSDLRGALLYLAASKDPLSSMKKAYELSFNRHASSSQQSYVNTIRTSGRDVRDFLDKKLSTTLSTKKEVTYPLKEYWTPDGATFGAESMMYPLKDTIDMIQGTWRYLVVEHIGTSQMNTDQIKKLFRKFHDKRTMQSFYSFVDTVENQFDRDNIEREIELFLASPELYTRS